MENKMATIEVSIKELGPMRMVSFHGFGAEPEGIAFAAMFEWAEKNYYFQMNSTRCFGFNNPDPTPGSSNYGYEVWLSIPEGMTVEDKPIKSFKGGFYAVANCSGPIEAGGTFIPAAWKALVEWMENSPYQMGKHQWLEEHKSVEGLSLPQMNAQGKLNLDLYLPIIK
ncbi:MAG: hypothetical protein CVU42_09425 [Chloroflexi bacterium HGW-Chloroflexi-4]|jgi:DNA gyrase inhibitor GyrI|nr:MAG: hypothetical protein CVU42_09425 [Chloroflexi bacterium HGW-Chloroflexi-4]